jgi:branched-chain amino acid transport system substrate-binding protein
VTTRIGLLFPLTGEWAWVGTPCLHAVRMALDLARERGRLGPDDVELIVGDVPVPERAAAEAERLADAGAEVLFGSMFSSHSFPASEVAAQRGLVFWEAVAAADALTQRGHERFFRLDTTARRYGEAVASFVAEQLAPAWDVPPGSLRLGVASMEESFCASMGDAMVAAAERLGLQVVTRERFPFGGADIPAVVAGLGRAKADVVFMVAFGPAVTEFGKLARATLPLRALIGNGAWALHHRVNEIGDRLDGVYSVDTPHISSLGTQGLTPDARERLEWWRARCGEPHSVKTAVDRDLVFIAANVLFEHVLPNARSSAPADIASAARKVDIPLGGSILGYGTRFSAGGENERAFAALLQWQDGVRETVYPDLVATAAPRLAPLPRA